MPLSSLLASFLVFFFLPIFILAQETSVSKQCLFSCPLTNANPTNPWPLVKRTHAIGWDSHYTIFECVYAVPSSHSDLSISEWKCAYDKVSNMPLIFIFTVNRLCCVSFTLSVLSWPGLACVRLTRIGVLLGHLLFPPTRLIYFLYTQSNCVADIILILCIFILIFISEQGVKLLLLHMITALQ